MANHFPSVAPPAAEITATLGPAEVVHFPLHHIELVVTDGRDKGAVCKVSGLRATIGTGAGSDLRVHDKRVSRCHCEVVARDGFYVLRDLGSKNGTMLNGLRIFEVVIAPGSTVTVGTQAIRFAPSLKWVPTFPSTDDHFGELVGATDVMAQTFGLMGRIASSDLTVLIHGETGTGKELAARAMHDRSKRSDAPLVVLDCATAAPQFIEDMLFGHVKGAFTGATEGTLGAFEEARGGTVFLDEVGELPLELQPKLLRVLERREVTRLGSHKNQRVDVRVIAATHRDLAEMVRIGTFREDLYYRLVEVMLPLPPLRQRQDDLPRVSRALLDRAGHDDVTLTDDAQAYLKAQSWPGNVRELRNVLRRAAALADSKVIDSALLEGLASPNLAVGGTGAVALRVAGSDELLGEDLCIRDATEQYRKAYIDRIVERFGDDLDAAADHVGVHIKSIQRLIRHYRS